MRKLTLLFIASFLLSSCMEAPSPMREGIPVNLSISSADKSIKERINLHAKVILLAPEKMGLTETKTVKLVLGIEQSIEQLRALFPNSVNTYESSAMVASITKAELTGLNFEIEKIGDSTRVISEREVTTWSWQVSPTKEGSQNLHFTLSALVNIEGESAPYVIQTFGKTIYVEVTTKDMFLGFISSYWQWIWSALLIPLWFFGRQKYKEWKRNRPVQF